MSNLNLALIGNCTIAALIDQMGTINWACMPRLDGDPVFCQLLSPVPIGNEEGGFFDVTLADFESSDQEYLAHTAIVRTILTDKNGGVVELVDFAPRFEQFGRYFRPASIVRMIRRLHGEPRIRIRIRPRFNYGAEVGVRSQGSNHMRWTNSDFALRVTTNAPLSYLADESFFYLRDEVSMIFGADEPLGVPIKDTAHQFLEQTQTYWRHFTRGLALPFEWQEAVIRSAITLKLCTFEDTGAVVAAVTTSLPEFRDSGRNWDYRFCWLRDSYFTIQALNRLGATKTMEDYVDFITNIAMESGANNKILQPLFGIGLEHHTEEWQAPALRGYRGMGPVRVGNAAYTQLQNDGYGSVILALTQAFFDSRLYDHATLELFHRLEEMGEKAIELHDKPDAGLWELRTKEKIHTFSSMMCWAACHRLAKIADSMGERYCADYWAGWADNIHRKICDNAWDAEQNSFVESFGGKDIDAALLLMHEIGFMPPGDPRFVGTVEAVERSLKRGMNLFRYIAPDDFGEPECAFNICTFWYIDALIAVGRTAEARTMFEHMLAQRNHVGLLSEDLHVESGELWGNFPQTYSMVGIINSALRLSKSWHEALSA